MVKDSSITMTITITAKPNSSFLSFRFLLMLLLLLLVLMLMFCGNAVLWKVMEKSGKSIRIFPQLTHNTWKSRKKRPTFPHSDHHKTFSLRSLKCGKTRYLNSHPKDFSQIPNLPFRFVYQIVFFHIPTISGYFLFYDKEDIGLKKMGPPNNMWVKKYLKRRGCGESFLRHKGRSEYSSLQLNSNTILSIKIILWLENCNAFGTKGFTGIRALFYPQILLKRQKNFKFPGKKAKSAFIFLNFMVYKNGNFNCRRGERLIVVDHPPSLHD